eukprot:1159928-Pelagomonas_calceolata.AAC.1
MAPAHRFVGVGVGGAAAACLVVLHARWHQPTNVSGRGCECWCMLGGAACSMALIHQLSVGVRAETCLVVLRARWRQTTNCQWVWVWVLVHAWWCYVLNGISPPTVNGFGCGC